MVALPASSAPLVAKIAEQAVMHTYATNIPHVPISQSGRRPIRSDIKAPDIAMTISSVESPFARMVSYAPATQLQMESPPFNPVWAVAEVIPIVLRI